MSELWNMAEIKFHTMLSEDLIAVGEIVAIRTLLLFYSNDVLWLYW